MLQSMRENMRGAIAVFIVIFLGLVLALGLVDFSSLGGGTSVRDVASVNGQPITQRDLQLAIAQERQRLQSQFGDNLPADFISDERLRQPVLQSLLQRTAILDKAVNGGMEVDDKQLDKLITEMPEFQADGKFDPQLFVARIRGIGHTPASFKVLLRNDLVVNQLSNGISATAFVTDAELQSIVELSRQTRAFEWVQLPLGDLPATITLSDEDISQYYEKNKLAYKTEEKVAVEYIDLKVSDISDTVIIGEDEIDNQYKVEVDQFTANIQREAAHIMIEGDDEAAQEKIKTIQEKLAAGEDFASLANEYSDDFGSKENGGNLGQSSGDTFPPEFEAALIELTPGSVSDPLKIDNATHFIKLISEQGVNPPSFEERKAQIESELKTLEAEQIYIAKLTELKDLSFNAESLSEVADQLNLTLAKTDLFTAAGGNDPILSDSRVVNAAYGDQVLQQGYASDVLELAPDRAIVIKLIEHEPVRQLSLDEKISDITVELKLEKAKEKLAAQAEEYKQALSEGVKLSKLAEQNNFQLNTESNIPRDGGGLNQTLVQHVFDLQRPQTDTPVTSSFYLDNNDYVLVSLSAVKDGSFEALSDEEKRNARLSLSRSMATVEFQAFQKQLVSEAKVELN